MKPSPLALLLTSLLLAGCADAPYVKSDSRGYFDTSKGLYGGNEFNARSVEGDIAVNGAVVPHKSPAPPAPPAETLVAIDANAYAAVFGATPAPVRPTAEQLMRLDSLALVAAEAPRIELQTGILACRRAAGACAIAIMKK